MQFALVNNERQEPQPKLSGQCPNCEREMIAKCGKVNVWHWAHKGKLQCDPWWENETEWHRNWKNQFPKDWHEIVHRSEAGEKHIADVKTDKGWVIELQHSRISPEERQSRNSFYKRIAWVVDGTRRKKDSEKFQETISDYNSIFTDVDMRRVDLQSNILLKEWADTGASVFFDFGKDEEFLWWMLPIKEDGKWTYLLKYARTEFIKLHLNDNAANTPNFESTLRYFLNAVVNWHNRFLQPNIRQQQYVQIPRMRPIQQRGFHQGFPQYPQQRRWKKSKWRK